MNNRIESGAAVKGLTFSAPKKCFFYNGSLSARIMLSGFPVSFEIKKNIFLNNQMPPFRQSIFLSIFTQFIPHN